MAIRIINSNNANELKVNADGSLNVVVVPDLKEFGTSVASSVSAAGAGLTLTLAGVPDKFHYIDSIRITKYTTATVAASATPLTVSSTNLDGFASTFATAQSAGLTMEEFSVFARSLRSTTAGANTTITCPASTNVIWRITVVYSVE